MEAAAQILTGSRAWLARPPRVRVLVVLSAAAVVLCAVSIHLATAEGVADIQVALLQWISLPYIAAGLIAWWRRPESRLGVLMIVVGFTTGLLALQFTDDPVLWTVGAALDIFPAAVFMHVSLAFPSGRLRSGRERFLVAATYGVAVGLQLVKLALADFLPLNAIGVVAEPDASDAVERAQLYLMAALLVVAAALLVLRRREAGRPRRRWLALVVDAFAVGLVMLAALYLAAVLEWEYFREIQRTALLVVGCAPFVFLLGLLDARLARGGVGNLVVRLRGNPSPAELAPALAAALRDPSLEVVYWLPQFGCYADGAGREVPLPGPDSARATTTIDRGGERVAALVHDPSLSDERELLDAVAAAAGIAIENARLQVELRARVEELRGSRARIVEVAQEERKRLERNLHDGAQQRLVALSMELGMLGDQLGPDAAARDRVERARGEIARSLAELREIAHGLHPAVVSDHGLEVALEQLVALAPVPVALTVRLDRRLPEQLEVAAYYLVSEGLANVGKHAQAGAATVDVTRAGDVVTVAVSDDGIGGADTEGGSGLRGMADRVEALGGRLRVWSPAGGGTRVSAELPCAS